MIRRAGCLLRQFSNYKLSRLCSISTQFRDHLDNQHVTVKATNSPRLITIQSPFDKGDRCYVDLINGGFFCPKSGQFGEYDQLEKALNGNLRDEGGLLTFDRLYDYKRLQDTLQPDGLKNSDELDEMLFAEALTRNDVEYPIDFAMRFYTHQYKKVRRLLLLESGESIFVDCPVVMPRSYTLLNEKKYHAAKLYHEDEYTSYIPSYRKYSSIQSAYLGLFSWRDYKKVILVDDEWDAMALESAGVNLLKMGVLPIGGIEFESDESPLDPRILPILSQMNEILIWPTSLGVEKGNFFEHLDQSCIFLQENSVPTPKKIKSRAEMMSILKRDEMYSEFVNLGSNLALSIDSLYAPDESIPFTRFSELNQIMGGFRKGELTLISGHTGKGKTTFMCEYSIDLALNGVKTLWGSFEMKLEALQKMQVMQLRRMGLLEAFSDENYDTTQTMFRNLGMMALNEEPGSMDPVMLIDKLARAVRDHDIQHIIIDNLQYLLYGAGDESMFAQQDNVIRMFRNFATEKDVHVTVICHPRKTMTSSSTTLNVLSEYDISGRARAIQESDNILIMQTSLRRNKPREDWLQVMKCRHGLGLGSMTLTFDPTTKTYHQDQPVDPEEHLRAGFLAIIDDDCSLNEVIPDSNAINAKNNEKIFEKIYEKDDDEDDDDEWRI